MDFYPRREGQPRWGMELQERLLDEALQVANMTQTMLEQLRPPLPQIREFPPRFGYPSYQRRQIGIGDIIDINRIYKDPRVTFTGGPAGYEGASRNSMTGVGRGWAE